MSETELLWQLRQMPRELEPGRDLWPGIAAGIGQPRRAARLRWIAPLAMAASVLLAVGLAYRVQQAAPPAANPAQAIASTVVARESRAVTDEYQAALRQFDGAPVPAEVAPALRDLDRSVVQIRRAIAADPGSVFLLEQLRRTYELRLDLTQRAVTG
jgi:hypothetical protein